MYYPHRLVYFCDLMPNDAFFPVDDEEGNVYKLRKRMPNDVFFYVDDEEDNVYKFHNQPNPVESRVLGRPFHAVVVDRPRNYSEDVTRFRMDRDTEVYFIME